jgi:hypothetical protein
MAIIQSGTSITFNDATTQTTAFKGNAILGQVFTSSSTFTIPTGVSSLKVTIVGGGGNGGQGGANGIFYAAGGGGGAGATAISYLTSLTPGNTIVVTVGAAGGLSRIASGTQSITTVTANGGSNGGDATSTSWQLGTKGSGGTASNGTVNMSGATGTVGSLYNIPCTTQGCTGGNGGNSIFGGGGGGGSSSYPGYENGTAGLAYGAGGGGGANTFYSFNGGGGSGGTGSQGIVIFEW